VYVSGHTLAKHLRYVVNTTTEDNDELEASSDISEPLFDKFPSGDGHQRASARTFAQVLVICVHI